jgi:DNA-binding CsgD family transcriptional regulator
VERRAVRRRDGQRHEPAGDIAQALAAPRPAAPRACDLLLEGFSLAFTQGRHAAAPVLRRAVAGFCGDTAATEETLRWGWLATGGAAMLWDYEACVAATTRQVRVARDSGALTVLAVGLNVLIQALCLGGDLPAAALLTAEADAVSQATETRVAPYGALLLAAMRGREAEALRLIDATTTDATAAGQGVAVQYARWAAVMLFNGLGSYERALTAARQASDDVPELSVSGWAAIDELTAQEAEIGQLAAAGRSNPEIGAQLFLSPRAVEWHLRKVFMKLGVSSRRELASALGETGRTAAPD